MLSSRTAFICLSIGLIPQLWYSPCSAQQAGKSSDPATQSKVSSSSTGETFVPLTIRPQAIVDSDLDLLLIPPLHEMSDGNAMLDYFRAMAFEYDGSRRWTSELMSKKSEWMKLPLDEIPLDEILGYTPSGAIPILEEGARKSYADMGLLARIHREGIETPLGEISALREVSKDLLLHTRVRIARDRFDSALRTIRTGFALARHLSGQSFAINYLVSTAMANQMISSLHDWNSRPGAPNLYWPLMHLPRPLLQADRIRESEALFVRLPVAPNDPMSAEKALTAYASWIRTQLPTEAYSVDPSSDEWKSAVSRFVESYFPIAVKALARQGSPSPEVMKPMPKEQVCLIAHHQHWNSQFRNITRWIAFDSWVTFDRVGIEREKSKAAHDPDLPKFAWKENSFDAFSSDQPVQFAVSMTTAKARVETQLEILILIERLRDLAAHNGELPDKIEPEASLPVKLLDHFTGEPIRYRRIDATTARIEAGPPPGMPGVNGANQLRYEIRLAK